MESSKSQPLEDIVVAVAVCLLLVIFCCRAPFTESFWLDETISAWIVSGSLDDVFRRSVAFQGQSPFYYSLLWCVRQIFGPSEIALRSLSIVCCLGVAGVVYRIARDVTQQRSMAILAVGALVGCSEFQNALLSARPYGLAILCATISVYSLLSLRERFDKKIAHIFTASVVGAWYSHYLFALILIPHLITIFRDRTLARRLMPWAVVGLIACAPGLAQWFALQSRLSGLASVDMPSLRLIAVGFMPIAVVVSFAVGLFMAVTSGATGILDAHTRKWLVFFAPYLLLPAVVFGGGSFIKGFSLWVSRYWAWQEVIWVIVAVLMMSRVSHVRARRHALLLIFFFFLAGIVSQVRIIEDWRGAATAAKSLQGDVALYSGLIEIETGSGSDQPEFNEYVRAPLLVYGVERPIQVIGMSYSQEDIGKVLRSSTVLVVSGSARSPNKFLSIAQKEGVEARQVFKQGLVSAFELTKKGEK